MIELGLVDRGQQVGSSSHLLRQRNTRLLLQSSMLTEKRQVVGELIHQHPSNEADIGKRAIEQRRRR